VSTASRKLGELLVDGRLLSRDLLERLLDDEQATGRPLARLLVDGNHVREEDVLKAVAERVRMPYLDLDDMFIDPVVAERLDAGRARALTAIPVKQSASALLVAVADPFTEHLKARLEEALETKVALGVATRSAISRALDLVHGTGPEAEPVESQPRDPVIAEMLAHVMDHGASDLHLTAGLPPEVRINGRLQPIDGYQPLMSAPLRRLLYGMLTDRQREKLEENLELDGSYPLPGRGRFRMNVFFQRDSIAAVFRAIPTDIQTLPQLGIPNVVNEFADFARGLVLITGPTGSGKSTTLASIIDLINQRRTAHILTVEDPIEFVHTHKNSIVNQREVGTDTLGFAQALRHALRQDPDVILVGEMRDLETISTALTAAETGHLVLATLHTQDASQTIDRIIDVFPAHQQQQVRVQLAATLQAVMTQQLVETRDGTGRVPAVEILIATPAIRNLVRDSKTHQISTALQAGGKYGMQTMDQSLAQLVRSHKITMNEALERCMNSEDLQRLVGRVA
jgi:twitching motility protein PilT